MVLAHTLGEGGPEIELLIVAAAFVVLGSLFFVQKTAKPAVAVGLVVVGVAMGASAFALGGGGAGSGSGEGIALEIVSPEDGTTVPANEPLPVDVELDGATLAGGSGGGDGGHIHIFVDEEIVDMPSTLTTDVEIEPGTHTIAVEYVDSDHKELSPRVLDEVEVTAE